MLSEERRQHCQIETEFLACGAALLRAQTDLVEIEDQARNAQKLAALDSLTSLPNRRHFGDCVRTALAGAVPAGVSVATLYLDLDGFKSINDMHGHHVGDQVLRIVAKRLVRALRAQDRVGRLGGDEFACLLTNLPDESQLKQLACKLFDAVSEPMRVDSLELTVRASIGIATYPRDGETSDALLRSADEAMYSAKRQQSGFAFFERGPALRAAVRGMHAGAT